MERVRKQSRLLGTIAGGYSHDSEEHEALRQATLALMYVHIQHPDEFQTFLLECDSDAAAAAAKHLAALRDRLKRP